MYSVIGKPINAHTYISSFDQCVLCLADVRKAILFARQHNIRPTISSSTHSFVGKVVVKPFHFGIHI